MISQLLRKPGHGLASLTTREREVLEVMAEGRSNAGVAGKVVLSGGAIEKHIASIFSKLSFEPEHGDNRRVLAVDCEDHVGADRGQTPAGERSP